MDKIIEYYNQLATRYDDDRFGNSYGKFIDSRERKILDSLLDGTKECVLDLACGSGRLLNYATHGVDASKEMVQIARQKFPDKEVSISDALTLPFPDNSVDTIISFHFFMHLDTEKIRSALLECHRILKPGGRIIFDIPSGKRRLLLNYKTKDWHGGTSLSVKQIQQINAGYYSTQKTFGLLLFPIHRFPVRIRKFLVKADALLAGSFLKEYSSYLIFECIKK